MYFKHTVLFITFVNARQITYKRLPRNIIARYLLCDSNLSTKMGTKVATAAAKINTTTSE